MQTDTNRVALFVALLVAVLAAAFVDARWVRAALVIVPLAFVATQLFAAGAATKAPPKAAKDAPDGEDRRSDNTIRRHIQQLLDLIREFYSTCHMVAVGQLSPAKAKQKAREVEEKLNVMMKDMLDRIDDEENGDGGSADDDHTP